MSAILVYALHYDGAFNKNSLGAVSEGARLAEQLGSECHAIVVGEGVSDDLAAQLSRSRLHTVGVVVLEEHQKRARLDHRPSSLHDQLQHTAELGLEAHRPRDRRGRLQPANGALQLGAPLGNALV